MTLSTSMLPKMSNLFFEGYDCDGDGFFFYMNFTVRLPKDRQLLACSHDSCTNEDVFDVYFAKDRFNTELSEPGFKKGVARQRGSRAPLSTTTAFLKCSRAKPMVVSQTDLPLWGIKKMRREFDFNWPIKPSKNLVTLMLGFVKVGKAFAVFLFCTDVSGL